MSELFDDPDAALIYQRLPAEHPHAALRDERVDQLAMWPRPIAVAMSAHLIVHPYIDRLKWFEEQITLRKRAVAQAAVEAVDVAI